MDVCWLVTVGACGSGAITAVDAGSEIDGLEGVCAPGPRGALWLEEGEELAVDVVCLTGLELAGSEFEIADLPDGASYDQVAGRLTWTPALDQAAVYEISISAPTYDEEGKLTIGVADKWSDPENVPVVDPLAYPLEYGLPVLFLSPAPTNTEEYEPATIVYRGHAYSAEAKKRGKSSLTYPKNSYTLQFSAGDPFSEPEFAGGFVDKRKVVLTTPFDDNSYIRTRLAFDLWNRLEPGPFEVQTYSAVVFLDGEYHGLYTVTDHIDRYLAYAAGLAASGNLYKAVNHDANFRLTRWEGGAKETLHDGYEKKEGLPEEGEPGAFDDLEALVEFVATAPDAEFATGISARVDLDNYYAWWLLVTFIRAQDSAGKNSYHYHDETSLWYTVPWDFNASFGQNWYTLRLDASTVQTYVDRNHLFERLLDDPSYGSYLRTRFAGELEEAFDRDSVLALVDSYVEEIDASARRDEARWRAEYLAFSRWSDRDDFTTYEQEIEYVRSWISERWVAYDGVY